MAGRVMVGIAVLGLVASVVGTVIGRQLVVALDDGMGQSLELSADVLATVDESFAVADETMGLVEEGVAEAQVAVRALGNSMAEGRAALDTATELTGEEVAGTIEAVEEALPAVEEAATAMDRTLSALDALPLGVPYDPEQPLGESIATMRAELEGLPAELRAQAEQTESVSRELALASESTLASADTLDSVQGSLSEAAALVEQYAGSATEARALVARHQDSVEASTRRASLAVLGLGVVFAVGQFVPLYLGVALLRGDLVRRRP